MKIGDKLYQYVLLHIRNGEQFAGLVEVPGDLKTDDEFYKRCLAADLLQPKAYAEPVPKEYEHRMSGVADRIIELRNPHQVVMPQPNAIAVISMKVGDLILFLRSVEILFVQFLDDKSPIVIEIRKSSSVLVDPSVKPGEERTGSGIILPGSVAQ